MMKTLKTPKPPGKTLKTPKPTGPSRVITRTKAVDLSESAGVPNKAPKGPTRVSAPQRVKTAVKSIKTPTPSDVQEQGETIRVIADLHQTEKTHIHPKWKGEREVEVPREIDREAKLKEFIEARGNFAAQDTLWHFGGMLFNNETYQESRDRVRLYYEAKASYPTREYLENTLGLKVGYFEGWMSGFLIGMAYGRDTIDEETIKNWERNRAEQIKGKPFDDDIPF